MSAQRGAAARYASDARGAARSAMIQRRHAQRATNDTTTALFLRGVRDDDVCSLMWRVQPRRTGSRLLCGRDDARYMQEQVEDVEG
jgi:hypothetical protein